MTRIPIYGFSSTTNLVSTDYVVVLQGQVPKLLPKSSLDTLYASTSSPTFTGTVSVPTPALNDYSNKVATTAYVKNMLTTGNILAGANTLSTVLQSKVSLAGALTGTADNPQIRATGVTPGTYTFATVQVGEDGRIIAANSNAVSGGSFVPKAKPTEAGTVKTDVTSNDPVVYIRESIDTNFISTTGVAKDITTTHKFSNGVELGNSYLTLGANPPTRNGIWFDSNKLRGYSTFAGISYGLQEKSISVNHHKVNVVDDTFIMHTSNVDTTDSFFMTSIALYFYYDNYTISDSYAMSIYEVTPEGAEVLRRSMAMPIFVNNRRSRITKGFFDVYGWSGTGAIKVAKLGNPGLLDLTYSIQYRLRK